MTTNVGLLVIGGGLDTFLSASSLGTARALAMAPSIILGEYSRSMSISFNSINRCSLVSGSQQILLILIESENGMESKHSSG